MNECELSEISQHFQIRCRHYQSYPKIHRSVTCSLTCSQQITHGEATRWRLQNAQQEPCGTSPPLIHKTLIHGALYHRVPIHSNKRPQLAHNSRPARGWDCVRDPTVGSTVLKSRRVLLGFSTLLTHLLTKLVHENVALCLTRWLGWGVLVKGPFWTFEGHERSGKEMGTRPKW